MNNLTDTLYSCVWPSRNYMVQILAAQGHPQQQKIRDCSASGCRPDPICAYQSIRLPQQHGDYGGIESTREVEEKLRRGAAKELDSMAVCTVGQLPASPAPSSTAGGQYCVVGLELLSLIYQQSKMSDS